VEVVDTRADDRTPACQNCCQLVAQRRLTGAVGPVDRDAEWMRQLELEQKPGE
jgi:hypothetical protein